MPNVTSAPLAWLAARSRENPAAAAVMLERDGRIEPLPAAFCASAAQMLLRAHLADGRLALHQLTQSPEVVAVPVPSDWPADFWVNLNTPSDLAAYNANAIAS
jgi:molybdopterin-guanine dinucleotide biosynthesis protein A